MFQPGKHLVKIKGIYNEYNNDSNNPRSYCYRKEWIIHLRRHFHQYPEASLKEYETIKRIKEELLAFIPFVEVGETGV